jgi:THO complex subunit 4
MVISAPNKIINKQPKGDKPKPVAKPAAGRGGARGGARGNKRGARSGSGSGRGKPKTAEQLDQDMSDYFGGDSTNASGAGPAAATTAATNGGDVGMDDTVLVGTP